MIKIIHSAKIANLYHSNGIKSGNKSALFQNGTKKKVDYSGEISAFSVKQVLYFSFIPFFLYICSALFKTVL